MLFCLLFVSRHTTFCGRLELNPMEHTGIFQGIECGPPKVEWRVELHDRREFDRHRAFRWIGIRGVEVEAAVDFFEPGFDLMDCFHGDESASDDWILSKKRRRV